jgi:hypothetical protein
MSEPVVSVEVAAERWERQGDGWGEIRLSTPPQLRHGRAGVEVRLTGIDPDVLTRLADPRARWRLTLERVEEAPDPALRSSNSDAASRDRATREATP